MCECRWQASPTTGVYTIGHHLIDALVHQAEEEGLVAVVKARQKDEFLERRRLGLEVLVHPLELLLDRADGRREQSVQVEFIALAGGERRALVGEGVHEERFALQRRGQVPLRG